MPLISLPRTLKGRKAYWDIPTIKEGDTRGGQFGRRFRSRKGPGQGKGQVGDKAGNGPHWSWGKGGFASLAGEKEVGIKREIWERVGHAGGLRRKDLVSPN